MNEDQAFASDPEAEPWVDACMNWLRLGFEYGTEAPSRPLRPPEESHWSLDLGEAMIRFMSEQKLVLPSEDQSPDSDQIDPSIARMRLKQLLLTLAQWQLRLVHDHANQQNQIALVVAEQMARLYQRTYRWRLPGVEGPILICVSISRAELALKLLAEMLSTWPPHEWNATAQALGPLVSHSDWKLEAVFPRLLDAIQFPTTIASVLDLANHCCRSQRVQEHPAKPLLPNLVALLGGTVGRLGQLEEDPTKFGSSVDEIQRILDESIALCVALCDALSWMNDASVIGKLHQAMDLSHRRVKTEAACALARLGDEAGRKALIALASDPVARLRAIKYAEELGFEEEIDEAWRLPQAIAEAELASWLAQPNHMGLPPHRMELLDERTCYWPGYHEPQTAYLFRYEYHFPDSELSNIGMAGPIVHSFAADLADLPEEDIYAAFAGWTAEHDDIYEIYLDDANSAQRQVVNQLQNHLEHEGYENIQPIFLGFFIQERSLVAQASKNQTSGIVVTDGLETLWLPTQARIRPLGPNEVYSIYKGRKLLRTFNG